MPNQKFQNAMQRIEQRTPPIWMMRQAGRYHKHYQALRAKHSFMELCKEPELAAEVAFGPVDEFGFDVAILFSDILFPLEALGMGLEYTDAGPRLGWHLDESTISQLRAVDDAIPNLEFQKKAIQITIQRLSKDISVIGFVGGPWTLFTYASVGKHEGSLVEAKKNPSLHAQFFPIMEELLTRNIQLQLDGGAEVVMIFDTAAGDLSLQEFDRLVYEPVKRLAAKFPKKLGYYSKNTSDTAISKMLQIQDLTGIGADHRVDLKSFFANNKIGFTQGNFDQALLFREGKDFLDTLKKYAEPFLELPPSERKGWVAGLGHGVLPKTPEQNVKLYVEKMREWFQ
jgi:uroporphyrinogen decarboxylase